MHLGGLVATRAEDRFGGVVTQGRRAAARTNIIVVKTLQTHSPE